MKFEDEPVSMSTEPLHGDERGEVVGYMDKVTFDYEIGGDILGSKVYPSPEAVHRHRGCGLVKVAVRLVEVVEDDDFDEQAKHARTASECRHDLAQLHADPDYHDWQKLRLKFDHAWRHFLKLTGRLEEVEKRVKDRGG